MSDPGRSSAEPSRFGLSAVSLVSVLVVFVGCAAQSEHYDDRDWTKEHGIQSGAWREVETLFTDADQDVDSFRHTLRGVRHDLTLRSGAEPDVRCACIDVAIGTPGDPRFDWASDAPKIAPENLVIALRSEGSQCPGASEARRPSIQAVDASTDDVTVVIEELSYERPQALGAIIQKPGRDGTLWVRAASKKLPYARSGTGSDACRVPTDPRLHHRQIRAGRRF